jgi:hypothetical protein
MNWVLDNVQIYRDIGIAEKDERSKTLTIPHDGSPRLDVLSLRGSARSNSNTLRIDRGQLGAVLDRLKLPKLATRLIHSNNGEFVHVPVYSNAGRLTHMCAYRDQTTSPCAPPIRGETDTATGLMLTHMQAFLYRRPKLR